MRKISQHELLYQLFITNRQLKRWVNPELNRLGLSFPLWRIMNYLLRSRALSQTELALLVGIQKAPLGQQIDRLETEHWLQRVRNPEDRRSNQLDITESGRLRFRPLKDLYKYQRAHWIAAMGEQTWLELQNTIEHLVEHFCSPETLTALQKIKSYDSIHLIGLLAQTSGRMLLDKTRHLGFTSCQWLVFSHIAQHENMTQRTLAEDISMQKAAVGQCLKELEQMQLIQRVQDHQDRRINRLHMNERAQPVLKKAQRYYQDIDKALVKCLSAKQQRHLRKSLLTLNEQLIEPTTIYSAIESTQQREL